MITRIRTTLDRDLTIRSVDGGCHEALGKSALEFVPPSHHNLLGTVARELFDRRRMVSCEIPILRVGEQEPRWWFVRAAPICEAGRAVAAVAHAIPRDHVAPARWQPFSIEAWERELALRELMPILQAFDAELISAIGSQPWAWDYAAGASPRGSSRPHLQADRARSTARCGRAPRTN